MSIGESAASPLGLHEAALEAFPYPVIVHTEVILFANAAARSVLQAPNGELEGRAISSIVHEDGRSAGDERRRLFQQNREARLSSFPTKLVTLNGTTLYALCDACRVNYDGGEAIMVVGRITGEQFRATKA